jgi:hypothetical protein|tara:strand:- start:61 stop:447 length:387 start_codon:yes stop_codon:yes gene_type:complete
MKSREVAKHITADLNRHGIEAQLVQSPKSEAAYVYVLGDPSGPPREYWVLNPKHGKVPGASRKMQITKPGKREVLAKVRVADHAGVYARSEADLSYVAENITKADLPGMVAEVLRQVRDSSGRFKKVD